MAKIPPRNLINEAIEEGEVLQEFREYIGMSGLAGPCRRRMWYDFRWCYDRTIPKRIQRLFNRGHYEESVMIADMQAQGMHTEYTGDNQYEFVDETGHIKGHPDGRVTKVPGAPVSPHLFEAKTMKASRYAAYMKKGLKESDPGYWGQIHTYMGEWGLTRCLFCVANKDTDERDWKRYEYDESVHKECMSIGFDVLTAVAPPKKIGERTWFECKTCNANKICHRGAPIKKTCRSCKHVNIEMEGKWSCGLYDEWLNYDDQMAACKLYELDEVFK